MTAGDPLAAARRGEARGSFAWFRRATFRVTWTIADQALIGAANFAVNLLLARWLSPAEYGGFMAASAIYWVIMAAHGGLLTEPAMVFGAGQFRDRLAVYFPILALFHWCVSALIAVGLAGAGFALMLSGSVFSAEALLGYAVAVSPSLLLQLVRRTFYIRSVPRLAAGTSAIYLAGTLAAIYLLYRSAALSAFTAPIAAAAASAAAMIAVASWRFRLWSSWRDRFVGEVLLAHWRYGRWAVVTGILNWVPGGGAYFLALPVLAGLEANAALGALRILVLPATQLNMAITLLLIPAFGRIRERRAVWLALLAIIAYAAVYAVVIGLFGGPLMDLLYRGRYAQYAHLCWLVGALAMPSAAMAVLSSALRAYERPDLVFWAYALAALVTGLSLFAVVAWGLVGALLGMLLSYLAGSVAMLWFFLGTGGAPAAPPTAPILDRYEGNDG